MSNILDFKTPSQLREELATKEEEVKSLRSDISNITAVNEMLKIQIFDLLDQLNGMANQIETIKTNLSKLQSKLPTLN